MSGLLSTAKEATGRNAQNPTLAELPHGVAARLIDDGMMHYEASIAGFAERYRRGETTHTIHVWWARRPHSAMRALVFASLCQERSEIALDLMRELSTVASVPKPTLERARELIASGYAERPKVLDMFGGGGTIPYEAVMLGADVCSVDSNELSVFVQRSILEQVQSLNPLKLQLLVKEAGTRVLRRLEEESAPLFPKRDRFTTYLWTYSTVCPHCGFTFFLSKRHWLSKKKGKAVGFEFPIEGNCQRVRITDTKSESSESSWSGRNGTVTCPGCKQIVSADVRKSKDELIATVSCNSGPGKLFGQDLDGVLPVSGVIEEAEEKALSSVGGALPVSELPIWSGIVNPAMYGIATHADFLNARQRAVLSLLIKSLKKEHEELAKRSKRTANAVVGILSGLVDQLVDWNCRLSMWIPQNEQVGRAFCGPGIAMLWDYAETDPVSDGPSNLWAKLDRIVAGAGAVSKLPSACKVTHGFAQELPFEDNVFDAIVTDPPYYDNIYYSVLADFFFAWKRVLLKAVEPSLFVSATVHSQRELVASSFRCGENAHDTYCKELHEAMAEAERVMKPDGVFALLYSHSSINGWEALVRAYRPTSLLITSVQPLSIERKQRPRAMTSDAINTCVVFVAHKNGQKAPATVDSMCERLRQFCESYQQELGAAGWQDEDIAVAVYAQGVGMLMNVTAALGCENDAAALKRFEAVVRERFRDFKVTSRTSL